MKMNGIILVIACLAAFMPVSSASASTVVIGPDPAYDNDDLYCYVDGSLKASLYYKWYANGNLVNDLVQGKYYMKDEKTMAGDLWECRAFSPNPIPDEDFILLGKDTIIIQTFQPPNNPPFTPSNPTPTNGQTGVDIGHDIFWSGGDPDGDTVGYDVYFGATTTPPRVSFNQASRSHNPGILSYSTTYYWKIAARDEHGLLSQGPLWSFTTGSMPPAPEHDPMIISISITPPSPHDSDTLTCTISVSDSDSDLANVEFKWLVNSVLVRANTFPASGASASASDQLPASQSVPNDIVKCEGRAIDATSRSDTEQALVTIQTDTPLQRDPVIESMQISPASPDEFDTLTCTASVSDLDSNLDRIEFKWSVNSVLTETDTLSLSGPSGTASGQLSPSQFDGSDIVKCEARVFDTTGRSDIEQRTVSIEGSPQSENNPIIESIQITPANPDEFDTLTCRVSVSDSDSNLESVEFEWFVNSFLAETDTLSASGSDDTVSDQLSPSEFDEGDAVRCEARVIDETGRTDTAQRTVSIEGDSSSLDRSPVIESIQITPSSPDEFDTLTCRVSVSDEDSDLERVEFRWFVNSFLTESDTEFVSGSDEVVSDQLSPSEFDDGDIVKCQARVFDESGRSDSEQRSVFIQDDGSASGNRNPTINSIQITPANPDELDTLTCRVSVSDSDSNLDRVEFRWFVDSRIERTETEDVSRSSDTASDQLPTSEFDSGDIVKCEARVFDTTGRSDIEQRTVSIEGDGDDDSEFDRSPIIDSLQITPANPDELDTLTCRVSVSDSDSNLDEVEITWKVNDILVITQPFFTGSRASYSTSLQLTTNYFDAGDKATCLVTVIDKTGREAVGSDFVRVSGQQPSQPDSVIVEGPEVLEVQILPKSLDIPVGSTEFIAVKITSTERNMFQISATGVPEDWLDFPASATVDGIKTVYIRVSPQETGSYRISVEVSAGQEFWDREISLFVPASSAGPGGGGGITGAATAGESNLILVLIIIAAVIIIAVAHAVYMRRKRRAALGLKRGSDAGLSS